SWPFPCPRQLYPCSSTATPGLAPKSGTVRKKAIALAQSTRTGMVADLDWVRRAEADLRRELLQAVADAQAECLKVIADDPSLNPVYKTDGDDNFLTS